MVKIVYEPIVINSKSYTTYLTAGIWMTLSVLEGHFLLQF